MPWFVVERGNFVDGDQTKEFAVVGAKVLSEGAHCLQYDKAEVHLIIVRRTMVIQILLSEDPDRQAILTAGFFTENTTIGEIKEGGKLFLETFTVSVGKSESFNPPTILHFSNSAILVEWYEDIPPVERRKSKL